MSDDYIRLPSQYDIDEYRIMEEFCLSLDSQDLSNKIYKSIQGTGAFRRFKDNIYRYNIQEDWFAYYKRALKEIAAQWCEENTINYME